MGWVEVMMVEEVEWRRWVVVVMMEEVERRCGVCGGGKGE